MHDALIRIERKVDLLDGRLDEIDKTLVKQHVQLEEHMRRTEAAEESLTLLKAELKPVFSVHEIGKIVVKTLAAVIFSAGGIGMIVEGVKKLLN